MPTVDESLLQRARAGESSAVDSVVHKVRPLIERQLLRYPISDEDRHDLLQITLIRVMCRLDTFRGDSSFGTWVYRVTTNEALMLMRAQRRHQTRVAEGVDIEAVDAERTSLDDEYEHQGDACAAQSQRNAWIRNALTNLSKAHRDVLIAHYHLDLGLHEIAHRLELSKGAVRSRLHRARRHLRAMLVESPLAVEVLAETSRPRRAA